MESKNIIKRCAWVNLDNPNYVQYHDEVWGEPVYDDRLLFEMLILEGAQAGLSWETILNKQKNYKKAFDDFNPAIVAMYDESKKSELMSNPGIVRNRRKIQSAIKNANVFLEIQKEFGSFSTYLWSFVEHKPIKNHFSSLSEVPTSSPLSDRISKELKKRGMSFVGTTIIYAYLQAVGVVNDHTLDCFKYK